MLGILQEIGKVPNIMDPKHPWFEVKKNLSKTAGPVESKIWVPYQYPVPRPDGVGEDTPRECRVEPTQLEHTVMKFKEYKPYEKKPGALFWDFLKCVVVEYLTETINLLCVCSFWRNGLPISRTFALSVGQNKYLRRHLPPLKDRQYEEEVPRILAMSEKTANIDPTATTYDPRWQSLSWRLQPLVVQDPFIPTYASICCNMLIY